MSLTRFSSDLVVAEPRLQTCLLSAGVGVGHACPESHCLIGVVTCHGCEDKPHVVGLALVGAAVLGVGKGEAP